MASRQWHRPASRDHRREITAYLRETLADDDPSAFAEAVGAVARANRNMTQLARDLGVSRAHLYKALSRDGNVSWSVLKRILRELGVRLQVSLSD